MCVALFYFIHSLSFILFLLRIIFSLWSVVWMYSYEPHTLYRKEEKKKKKQQPNRLFFLRTVRRLLNGSLRLVNIVSVWILLLFDSLLQWKRETRWGTTTTSVICGCWWSYCHIAVWRLWKWVTDCTKNDIHL